MRETAGEAADALFLRQRLHSLFIDTVKLQYDKNVVFASIQDFCRSTKMTMDEARGEKDLRDGCTLVKTINGKTSYIVLYNAEQRNPRRRAFTLAHEIGHIYLGHLDDGERNEAQANLFASELLMPECLLREYLRINGGGASAAELCRVFNISHEAAAVRLRFCGSSSESVLSQNDYNTEIIKRFSGLLPYPDGPIVTI